MSESWWGRPSLQISRPATRLYQLSGPTVARSLHPITAAQTVSTTTTSAFRSRAPAIRLGRLSKAAGAAGAWTVTDIPLHKSYRNAGTVALAVGRLGPSRLVDIIRLGEALPETNVVLRTE